MMYNLHVHCKAGHFFEIITQKVKVFKLGLQNAIILMKSKSFWKIRPQERPKTRKRMRRAGRGGALREGRIAKEAKTRQERRWTARYWAIGGRFGGGWLEATPASSRPGKDWGAPVCCLKITCQVTSSHHLQAELVVARQILHFQQILSNARKKLDKKNVLSPWRWWTLCLH